MRNHKSRIGVGSFDDPEIPLPTLESVKEAIDGILLHEKWDRHKISRGPKQFIKKVQRIFFEHLPVFPHIIQPNSTVPDLLFYRVRTPTKNFNEQLIGDYSFPPNHVARSYQRCNIPHHPVFYCSNDPRTAISETVYSRSVWNNTTPCYLSEWRVRANATAHITPFVFGNVDAGNPFYEFSEQNLTKLRELVVNHPEEKIDGFVEVMRFLSKLFVFDNTYSISAFIAHSHLYAQHNLRTDIFLYPSVKNQLQGVNLAIHPNCVQHKMELSKVYKLYVVKVNRENGTFTGRFVSTGINDNGVILWRPFDKDDSINARLLNELHPVDEDPSMALP